MLAMLLAAILQAASTQPMPALCSMDNGVPARCLLVLTSDDDIAVVTVGDETAALSLAGYAVNNTTIALTHIVLDGKVAPVIGTCRFNPAVMTCKFSQAHDATDREFKLEVVNPNA